MTDQPPPPKPTVGALNDAYHLAQAMTTALIAGDPLVAAELERSAPPETLKLLGIAFAGLTSGLFAGLYGAIAGMSGPGGGPALLDYDQLGEAWAQYLSVVEGVRSDVVSDYARRMGRGGNGAG